MQTTRTNRFYLFLLTALPLMMAGCATTPAPGTPAVDTVAAPAATPQEVIPATPALGYFEQAREDLTAQLSDALRQGIIQIDYPRENDLEITLPEDTNFTDSSAVLRTDAQGVLNRLAAVIRRFDKTSVAIIGYSDNAGNPVQEQQLSEARARQVAEYLTAQGIAAGRLQVAGRGRQNPRASNRTEFGRYLNRRIQISVRPAAAD